MANINKQSMQSSKEKKINLFATNLMQVALTFKCEPVTVENPLNVYQNRMLQAIPKPVLIFSIHLQFHIFTAVGCRPCMTSNSQPPSYVMLHIRLPQTNLGRCNLPNLNHQKTSLLQNYRRQKFQKLWIRRIDEKINFVLYTQLDGHVKANDQIIMTKICRTEEFRPSPFTKYFNDGQLTVSSDTRETNDIYGHLSLKLNSSFENGSKSKCPLTLILNLVLTGLV